MSAAGPIVSARGLCRTYRSGEERVAALTDVWLDVARGEFTVLAGPSGSGKTTLLNLLGLLDTPDAGSLVVEGREASSLDERGRARVRRERLGFVFQSHQLVPVLTAEENVAFPRWLRERPEGECREKARAALGAVGLAGLGGRRPDALSGGQRQRVAVARAIVGEPALVLADEPTASLDSETALRLVDLLWTLNRERGVTFLFSSHDPRVVDRAARRIDLSDGRVAADTGREPGAARDVAAACAAGAGRA